MIYDFSNLSSVGIVKDVSPHILPEGAWPDGNKIRFADGKVQKMTGHEQVFNDLTVAPHWLLPVPTTVSYFWMYAGTAKVYVTDGTTHTDVTWATGDYTPTDDIKHTGGVLGGIPVISNGVDCPQVWNPQTAATAFAAAKWDATLTWATVATTGHTCRAFRTVKSFWVALDVNKAGTRKPYLVKWSHPAEPGAEPVTWDEADATKLAGEVDLAQTSGFVVDCLPLGNTNIIYKEDSIWGMQFIGGNDVFRFFPIYDGHGIMSTDCVVEVDKRHVVLTPEDVIIHDGQSQPKSILDKKWRTWLINNIDTTNYRQSYVAKDPIKSEVWICIPTTAALYPDKALVWNWRDNTLGVRDLPNAPHISYGAVSEQISTAYDDQTATYDASTEVYDRTVFNPSTRRFLIANTNLFKSNETNTFDGTAFTSNIIRTGISFGDPNTRKKVKKVWLQMEGTGPVNVSIGVHDRPDETPTYDTAVSFDPTTDRKVDVVADGFYIAFKIESTTDTDWTLSGLQFELEETGKR